jgi:4-diphosphocytidyl-2-C-methyl-D-erythritol kinase
MFPVPLNDVLEVVPANEFKFSSSGMPIPGNKEDNLCAKAYDLIKSEFSIHPVHFHLYKNIPMGGGLGGGSSDGTAALKLLNDEFELGLSSSRLKNLAMSLGSDCPFFVEETPQLATGRGEVLKTVELDLSDYYLLLINDGTHISTKEAYANVVPKEPENNLEELITLPVNDWKGIVVNQFEESVFQLYPHLEAWKAKLYAYGADYASMSGSGATMYGLFKQPPILESLDRERLTLSELIKL